ncbi:MAG: hypothetical protein HQ581_19370 [Planctomycetes bacterium]|nr:hypothetical protein [Planctomycetota bacterium]
MGTMIAAGIVEFELDGFPGTAWGIMLLVGAFGLPVNMAVVIIGWTTWTSRYRVALAGLAGGLTCLLPIWSAFFVMHQLPVANLLVLAIPTGTGILGGVAGAIVYQKGNRSQRQCRRVDDKGVWQFTLRDMFLRMTVLAILLSASAWYVRGLTDFRERLMRRLEEEHGPAPSAGAGIVSPPESTEAGSDDPSE